VDAVHENKELELSVVVAAVVAAAAAVVVVVVVVAILGNIHSLSDRPLNLFSLKSYFLQIKSVYHLIDALNSYPYRIYFSDIVSCRFIDINGILCFHITLSRVTTTAYNAKYKPI
jgi:hypothetical protein